MAGPTVKLHLHRRPDWALVFVFGMATLAILLLVFWAGGASARPLDGPSRNPAAASGRVMVQDSGTSGPSLNSDQLVVALIELLDQSMRAVCAIHTLSFKSIKLT